MRSVVVSRKNDWGRSKIELLEPRRLMSVTQPTAAEQYMLELINSARANPAAEAASLGIDLNEGLAAGTISTDPKQPVAFNPSLIDAARAHDAWMIQNNTFAHNEGSIDPGAQMRAAGYPFSGSWSWGQNIAFRGQTPDAPPLVPTVRQEEQDLFIDRSEPGRGHRLNLLSPDFKELGVGVATGAFQGYNSVLATQDFAYEGGDSFLTGVAYADTVVADQFYTPGEGLAGITITATRASDNAVFTATTWSSGGYSLPLDSGTYTVTASGPGLPTTTVPNVVIGSQNVKLDFRPMPAPPSDSTPPVAPTPPTNPAPPAALAPVVPAIVTGTIFRDRNGDGIQERGEGGLSHWRVFADLNGDGIWQRSEPSTFTNARGRFRLKLPPGTYQIREVMKPRYTPIAPASAEVDVTVTDGQSVTGIVFADQLIPIVHHHRHR